MDFDLCGSVLAAAADSADAPAPRRAGETLTLCGSVLAADPFQ